MPGALAVPLAADSFDFDNAHFLPSFWVPYFRPITCRTRFVLLPSSFLSSLFSSLYTLPTETPTYLHWSDGTTTTNSNTPSAQPPPHAIEAEIEVSISELGGAVSPKLRHICPIDATWANFHRSTKCTTVDDIKMLIGSSERILQHLHHSQQRLQSHEPRSEILTLRQWADMDDRMEFRAFVKDDTLLAVEPRKQGGEYSQADMDDLVHKITAWYIRCVRSRFRGGSTYVMDVYVDRGGRVWLVDFAPWGAAGQSGLFGWEELEEAAWMETVGRAQFRCVRGGGIRAGRGMLDGLPLELRHTNAMRELADAAERLIRAENGRGDVADDELSADVSSEEGE